MKKGFISFMIGVFILTVLAIPAAAADGGAHIFVNGAPIKAKSVTKNGVSFVPFRELFEKLGMGIGYNAKLNQVTGTKKDLKLTFTLGSKTAYVNGQKKALQAAPFTKNGATYIPVRIVGEATGNAVYWTAEANLIQINSPSFKGASYTIDGIPVVIDANGTVSFGPGALNQQKMQRELAEQESIRNFIESLPPSRKVGEPPTKKQSQDPGYKGYPDYFDDNYVEAAGENKDLPPLMSKGWISLSMLSEIENINRVENEDPNTITLARYDQANGVFRFDIVMTDAYKKAKNGSFVLSGIQVTKYNGTMYLNIEDLKNAEVIDTKPKEPSNNLA
ncbi:copper amine oxidase N-terminal domain-containing protein [Paenibacillus nasutitermitis]|uniref:Copper amine oxidase-like N-terminal domain-containing protein n=1 Tax=Paenibacillus nasutitermitis TaxID=1652958 RepID=A0A917DWU9_9BACL|nr:copper amine oxidase N-terminal domain-containing protein [Paenibacillus nasutitermitis]GGD76375.1 hypothetical protein GCM10010911_38050 [Paenibacillus nasutitermitis]